MPIPKNAGASATCSAARLRLRSASAPELYGHVHFPPAVVPPTCLPSPAMSSTRVERSATLPPTSPILCPPTCPEHPDPARTARHRHPPPGEGDRRRRRPGFFPAELAFASAIDSPASAQGQLSLTILLETDTTDRFDTRQQFCSMPGCAVPCSPPTTCGSRRRQQEGRQRLAEVGLLRGRRAQHAQKDERIGGLLNRLASRLGKAKACTLLGPGPQAGPGLLSHATHQGGL